MCIVFNFISITMCFFVETVTEKIPRSVFLGTDNNHRFTWLGLISAHFHVTANSMTLQLVLYSDLCPFPFDKASWVKEFTVMGRRLNGMREGIKSKVITMTKVYNKDPLSQPHPCTIYTQVRCPTHQDVHGAPLLRQPESGGMNLY